MTMWKGSIASVTVPHLRTMSMADFNDVPASSRKVSARRELVELFRRHPDEAGESS